LAHGAGSKEHGAWRVAQKTNAFRQDGVLIQN
jgi:hypothetical protein